MSTNESSFGFDERSILSIHLVVETASVAEVVSGTISPPQRGAGGPTVHALPTLGVHGVCGHRCREWGDYGLTMKSTVGFVGTAVVNGGLGLGNEIDHGGWGHCC